MRIKEFAEARGVDMKAVSRYMKRHEMAYNQETGLTDEQLAVLEKKYPLPSPVQVVEDTEARKMLIETQKALIEAQNALIKAQAQLAQAEAQKLLLEDREAQLAALKEDLSKFEPTVFGLYKKKR